MSNGPYTEADKQAWEANFMPARREIATWPVYIRDAWHDMGRQLCAGCLMPLFPRRAGGNEPGYRGFEPCRCGKGHETPRPTMPK